VNADDARGCCTAHITRAQVGKLTDSRVTAAGQVESPPPPPATLYAMSGCDHDGVTFE